MRLLVKKLGRGMLESVVREVLEYMNIRVLGVTKLRSGRRDQKPAKDRPRTPNSLYRGRDCRRSPPYRYERTAGRPLCRVDGPGRGVESSFEGAC